MSPRDEITSPAISPTLGTPWVRLGRLSIAFACVLFHASCVYLHTRVPVAWQQAMNRRAPSIAGTYRANGERIFEEGGYRVGGGNLPDVFCDVTADRGFCPPAHTIRLRPVGKDELEITALNHDEVIATKRLAADIGAETSLDGVRVERPSNPKNSKVTGLKTRNDAVLTKGADGYLYVHEKHRATATFGGVVPFAGGGESWLRFPPAP